ncbi:unnamed protein product [Cyprideis torosa]|uniref:Uncharacterized protein n=1 Tax=Cyprideis torosa TaxID=163714 RepID=A0A7R8WCC7_9CRUS|nr:unnamed protein product [Cyprideis torosa]CAG0893202.1 unnamed protein product [Cyprideis torosa]
MSEKFRRWVPRTVPLTKVVLTARRYTVAVAFARQAFEREPSYTEINPGGTEVLHCRIYELRGECSWQKDGKPVGIYKNKYEWAGNPDLGDCSLRVLNADLDFDDGDWECQVTASTYQSKDALTSRPAKVVVRVAPTKPKISLSSVEISSGNNISLREGNPTAVTCISRYGNPAAEVKWFIGNTDISNHAIHRNASESDSDKTWLATSTLNFTFGREHHLQRLRCVAIHQAYDTKSRESNAVLDMQYAPIIKVVGVPDEDIEEGVDSLLLRCQVHANPPAKVVWKKISQDGIYSLEPELSFKPVTREDSGSYMCEAQNEIGSALGRSVQLNVKYAPRILEIRPQAQTTAQAFNSTSFTCVADGNPMPHFEWLQQAGVRNESVFSRGRNSTLRINNVTYGHQGMYVCQASNSINGKERKARSEPIFLQVRGAPQILRYSEETTVKRGEDGLLRVVFCSDPPPIRSSWQWGSLAVEVGRTHGKYSAQNLTTNGDREDCYDAQLLVRRAELGDSRSYFFQIDNGRGKDGFEVDLRVIEPVAVTTVAGGIICVVVILASLVVVMLYAFKSEKCCFSEKNFKSDMQKRSDIEKAGLHGTAVEGRKRSLGGGAISPDALYGSPVKDGKDFDHGGTPNGYRQQHVSNSNIIYADLQLPRSSNNGSMRRTPNNKSDHSSIRLSPNGLRGGEAVEV